MQRADVSLRDREARVAYDPVKVTVEQMIAVVNAAGFRASVKRQGRVRGRIGPPVKALPEMLLQPSLAGACTPHRRPCFLQANRLERKTSSRGRGIAYHGYQWAGAYSFH